MLESNREKTWYTDSELQEFRDIISEILRIAKEELGTFTQS